MPMIKTCTARGCSTLTMGDRCVEHESPASDLPTFPRGRPYQTVHPPSISRASAASTRAVRVGQRVVIVLAALGLLVSAVPADGRTVASSTYPTHTNITATVFWIGEPVGNGSTENNAVSAYDDRWLEHYGGTDDHGYVRRYPYFPRFVPHENPFYLDLPYDDFLADGSPRPARMRDVPWAAAESDYIAAAMKRNTPFSLMKNRWVKVSHMRNGTVRTCYGQVEDAGPYRYDDADYVFGNGDARPRNHRAHNAGIDVSPALRDCLGFTGLNNDSNRVSWQFVAQTEPPPGPWRRVVTTRQVFWP
jgi:hypothetical protein